MRFAVEFTTGARQDLLKIYRFIKTAGRPETVKRLYRKILDACAGLSQLTTQDLKSSGFPSLLGRS